MRGCVLGREISGGTKAPNNMVKIENSKQFEVFGAFEPQSGKEEGQVEDEV